MPSGTSSSGPVNSLATTVTKIGYEAVLSYNLGHFNDVGQFTFSGPGAGTFNTLSEFNSPPFTAFSLPSSGENLVVRANVPIQSASDIVVTIIGTNDSSAPCTGTATIKAYSPRGQAYNVAISGAAGQLWKTVTSVSATNGVLGDGFDVSVVPHYQDDNELLYIEQITPTLGNAIKPIYNRYTLMHVKRIRLENKISIGAFYTNQRDNLTAIDDRYVTLRMDIHDDGGNQITETRYFDRARMIINVDQAADGAENIRGKADGFFIRQFIFD